MKNDLNKPLKKYDGQSTYTECICFNFNKKVHEFENTTDLTVTAEDISFDPEFLTDNQVDEVQTFAEGIQNQIRKQSQFERMCDATERSLIYN